MTSMEYVTNAIHNLEDTLARDGAQPLKIFGKKAGENPFPSNYRLELDVYLVSDDTLMSRYFQLILVLRWAKELGRIDIMTEVSVLSQIQCQPRSGHLAAIYCVFWYLKCNLKEISGRIVFYSKITDIDQQLFHPSNKSVLEELYTDAEKGIPGNSPPPRGKPVYVGCYVGTDNAGNLLTRKSHTRIIIFVNNYPTIWYSKRHNTVQSSRFGSTFIALRIETDMI